MENLAQWESFYIIIGPAAGALIGLQFIVMALIGEKSKVPEPTAAAAFLTPTIVHFSVVLLVSALARVPWLAVQYLSYVWVLIGAAGLIYCLLTGQRMTRQNYYKPQIEDWIYYLVLPAVSNVALVGSAIFSLFNFQMAQFGVGAATLLLLFVGIRNAWDNVTYQVLIRLETGRKLKK